uniref:Glycosyltransferase family 1 protein n=1 Tax=candidate division WWE3 bacterium TaxID=2053526 RepID=A0A7C4XMY6_UNCKA
MRVGIDCRLWSVSTGRYIREIVGRIAEKDSKNEYVVFFLTKDINKVTFPTNFKKVAVDIHWHTFKEQFFLPFIFMKERLDVLHVPYFNVPVFYPKRFVSTIHDLTILKIDTGRASTRSYLFYKIRKLGAWIAFWIAVLRSYKVLTVSEFVKADIVKQFHIKPENVIVTTNAVSNSFVRASEEKIRFTLEKYKIKQPYLFYVGNAHPHKNVEGLITAFEKVHSKKSDLQLVLGGEKHFFHERLEREWSSKPIFNSLNFVGYIDEDDLPALYSGAELFVNPSFFEGFGLQLLEAFSCGTKVACSNSTSLPEVGGDAAYYFDPKDTDDMAKPIILALDDKADVKVKLGYERTKKFSWNESAQKTLKVYEDCFSSR